MSSSTPARGRGVRHRGVLLGLAALSLLSSLAFVLAPVERPDAVYSWPSTGSDATAVAIPLMLSKPAELSADIGCDAARAAARAEGDDAVLLSTLPLQEVPSAEVLQGLRVTAGEDGLHVRTGGTDLSVQEIPGSGDCTWTLDSTAASTVLRQGDRVVQELPGDLRPVVAGVFSGRDDADGLSVDVTADTVFQTTPSFLKVTLGVLAVLSLLAALALVLLGERRRDDAEAAAPVEEDTADGRRGGRLVRVLTDVAVVVGLLGWTVIGPLTVDDGYISGIIRSREANGYIGNVYRWFNAPEAPFGWFYEVVQWWSQISDATLWMRLPSSLLGIATWFLVGRGLLRRLGRFPLGPAAYVGAAAAFAVWWLASNLGLRPEAWVACGLAAVLVLVERGLAGQRLLPVLVAFAVAGATLAVTPTGAVAFLPLLVALVPVLRLARRADGPGLVVLTVVALAAAASALLLMFTDQSLAAVLRANTIRTDLPGSVPWSQEAERWYMLLKAGEQQGSIIRRVPVLLTVAAVVGVLWRRLTGRWPDGVARDVVDRLLGTFGLSLVVLLFTPTKWTMHFGALVPVGVGLVVTALHLFGRRATWAAEPHDGPVLRDRVPVPALGTATVALAAVLFVAAWSYAGWNQYAFLSNLAVTWNHNAPIVLGVGLSTLFVAAAVAVALVGTVLLVVARTRGDDDVRVPAARWLPSPALAAVVLMLITVALPYATLLRALGPRSGAYTLASDAVDSLQGRSCGLADHLTVERSPAAGLLEASPATSEDRDEPLLDGFEEIRDGETASGPALEMAGDRLPGWSATGHTDADGTGAAQLVTGWYELPDGWTRGHLPLVVSTTGERGAGTNLIAEFGTVDGDRVSPVGAQGLAASGEEPAATDARLDPVTAPPDAQVVRILATDGGAADDVPLSVSVPRVPVTVPLADVVDPDEPVIVDWPVAFVFPCQRLSVQRDGVTDVPRYRIGSIGDAGDIVIAEFVGGPYAPANTLVDQVRLPVYDRTLPLERLVNLYSWQPRVETTQPRREVTGTTVAGWAD